MTILFGKVTRTCSLRKRYSNLFHLGKCLESVPLGSWPECFPFLGKWLQKMTRICSIREGDSNLSLWECDSNLFHLEMWLEFVPFGKVTRICSSGNVTRIFSFVKVTNISFSRKITQIYSFSERDQNFFPFGWVTGICSFLRRWLECLTFGKKTHYFDPRPGERDSKMCSSEEKQTNRNLVLQENHDGGQMTWIYSFSTAVQICPNGTTARICSYGAKTRINILFPWDAVRIFTYGAKLDQN